MSIRTRGRTLTGLLLAIPLALAGLTIGGATAGAQPVAPTDPTTGVVAGDAGRTVADAMTDGDATAVAAADERASLPDHIVNGDFQTFGNAIIDQHVTGRTYLNLVDGNGWTLKNGPNKPWTKFGGWDAARFGWKSNDTWAGGHTSIVEVQRSQNAKKGSSGNVWGEIAAANSGRYIYQDIATTPGVAYKWSLRHASRDATRTDAMQVIIGGQTQTATRTKANGLGDKVGVSSTTISTKGTGQAGQWETYEGTYIATGSTTRFTFKSLTDVPGQPGYGEAEGNLIDDVTFTKAYPLTYDANGGAKTAASPIALTSTGEDGGHVAQTAADTSAEQIVNGGFSYPGAAALGLRTTSDGATSFVGVERRNRLVYHCASGNRWTALPGGFDANRFGWDSTETNGTPDAPTGCTNQRRANGVELQLDVSGNIYAEITAAQKNTALYQTLSTTRGVAYKVSLRHASKVREHVDSMRVVMVAADGTRTHVPMTRVKANGNGDRTGVTSTIIASKTSIPSSTVDKRRDYGSQWETYEGTYIATSSQTRFTFEAVSSQSGVTGNLIDDISFSKAYPLSYDANGGGKTSTSPIGAIMRDGDGRAAVAAADARASLPDQIVNGGFQTYGNKIIDMRSCLAASQNKLTFVDRNGMVMTCGDWKRLSGWDASRFGWKSDNTHPKGYQGVVELQRPTNTKVGATGNVWAEIASAQPGKYIYQDIATTPGVAYKWSIRHASRRSTHNDSMQVIIGGKAQTATRTRANGLGDKVGVSSTTITTKGIGDAGQWETYEGTYVATSTVTRFTFKSLSGAQDGTGDSAEGNLIDDVTFTKAYPLTYDANGGAKNAASPIAYEQQQADAASGEHAVRTAVVREDGSVRVDTAATASTMAGCAVYYPAGTVVTLATKARDGDCWDSSMISKSGRTFYGWSESKQADTGSASTLASANRLRITMPASAKTVYAQWAINPTLTYDVNAPQGETPQTAPSRHTVIWNTAPGDTSGWTVGKRVGHYVFRGWSPSRSGGSLYDFTRPLTDDTTVYAKWEPDGYTIVFDAGATDAKGSTGSMRMSWGQSRQLTPNGFTRDGYAFDHWESDGVSYRDGQTVANLTETANGVVTMRAVWSGSTAKIVYHANGGIGDDVTQNARLGTTVLAYSNRFTNMGGRSFLYWSYSPDGLSRVEPATPVHVFSPVTDLYAIWSNDGYCTITYHRNTSATDDETRIDANRCGSSIPTRSPGDFSWSHEGHKFITWNTKADGTGDSGFPSELIGDVHVYAQWAKTGVRLSYDGNFATSGTMDDQTGDEGDTLTLNRNRYQRTGYTFLGWKTRGGTTLILDGAQYTLPGQNVTLYAQWQANPAVIHYNADAPDATGSTPDTTATIGERRPLAANGFTRVGYTFKHWIRRSSAGSTALQPGSEYTLTETEVTLYASWEANPASITYKPNAADATGSTPDTTGRYGDVAELAANGFTRPGYSFTGWTPTPADDPTAKAQPGDDVTLQGEVVMYAQWNINRVNLSFDANKGEGAYVPLDGDAFSLIAIPADADGTTFTRDGYRFDGWMTTPDGTTVAYQPNDEVPMRDHDVTLYAKWTPVSVTLPMTGGRRVSVDVMFAGAFVAAVGLCVAIMAGYSRLSRSGGRHRR